MNTKANEMCANRCQITKIQITKITQYCLKRNELGNHKNRFTNFCSTSMLKLAHNCWFPSDWRCCLKWNHLGRCAVSTVSVSRPRWRRCQRSHARQHSDPGIHRQCFFLWGCSLPSPYNRHVSATLPDRNLRPLQTQRNTFKKLSYRIETAHQGPEKPRLLEKKYLGF